MIHFALAVAHFKYKKRALLCILRLLTMLFLNIILKYVVLTPQKKLG